MRLNMVKVEGLSRGLLRVLLTVKLPEGSLTALVFNHSKLWHSWNHEIICYSVYPTTYNNKNMVIYI